MNSYRSCYGGAKARALNGEQHGEADGVCSKCMLQRSKADFIIFIESVFLLLILSCGKGAMGFLLGYGGVEVGFRRRVL